MINSIVFMKQSYILKVCELFKRFNTKCLEWEDFIKIDMSGSVGIDLFGLVLLISCLIT